MCSSKHNGRHLPKGRSSGFVSRLGQKQRQISKYLVDLIKAATHTTKGDVSMNSENTVPSTGAGTISNQQAYGKMPDIESPLENKTGPSESQDVLTKRASESEQPRAKIPEERTAEEQTAPPAEARTTGDPEKVDAAPIPDQVQDGFQKLEAVLAENQQAILETFEKKLTYDRFKEEQIDRLHTELVAYKRDLLTKTTRPLVEGLVRLYGGLQKTEHDLQKFAAEDLTPDLLFETLAGFRDDLEIVLEQQGVVLFSEPEEKFNPRRQTCRRNVPCEDESMIGLIADRRTPGFEQNGEILKKELVEVYIRSGKKNATTETAPISQPAEVVATTNQTGAEHE